MARFWPRVRIAGLDECWEWQACKTPAGYPIFSDAEFRKVYAHRFLLERTLGRPLDRSEHTRHTCDNPSCVNPRHLCPGTAADNEADKVAKQRQALGERHGMHKLTESDVREIRAKACVESQAALAERFGVGQPHISSILRRTVWAHV